MTQKKKREPEKPEKPEKPERCPAEKAGTSSPHGDPGVGGPQGGDHLLEADRRQEVAVAVVPGADRSIDHDENRDARPSGKTGGAQRGC